MRTVIYSMGVSVDCYIAGPDGSDWGIPDAELHRFHNQQTREHACIYSDDASTR